MKKVFLILFMSFITVSASASLNVRMIDMRTNRGVEISKNNLYYAFDPVKKVVILKGFKTLEGNAIILDQKIAKASGYNSIEQMFKMIGMVSKYEGKTFLLECQVVQGSTEIQNCSLS